MPTDLDDLFDAASPPPEDGPDADRLWSAGRRRRRWRQAGAGLGGLALVAVVGLAATTLTDLGTPTVDSAATDQPTTPEPAAPPPDREVVYPDPEPEEADEEEPAEDPAAEEAEESTAEEPAPGPEPDAARVAEPCAAHEGGEMRAFIDVVAPVDGQRVSDAPQLAGCASVYEGTVRYRLVGPGGAVVADDFTTATAGGPELGEFRQQLPTGGSGEHTLEVFWEDAADGSRRGVTTVTFTVD